jgi:hypothetical protein
MKNKIIIGIILIVGLCILLLSKCSNIRVNEIQNMKPFADKPTIGKILNSNGKWTSDRTQRGFEKVDEVKYVGKVHTTNNKDVIVTINAYYEDGHKEIGDLEYSVDGVQVNAVKFLRFLYNVDVKDITLDNLKVVYPFNLSQQIYNDMREEPGYIEKNSNTNSSVNESSKAKSSSINLEKYAVEVSDEDKLNNPNSLKLIDNVSLRSDNILMQADFLETKYNGKALKDIFSVINNSKAIKGSKEDDGFFIFVEGTINSTPVSLRFKYQGNTILLCDSDINNNESLRVPCEKIKELIFDDYSK